MVWESNGKGLFPLFRERSQLLLVNEYVAACESLPEVAVIVTEVVWDL